VFEAALCSLYQTLIAEAQRDTPQPRHGLDVLLALIIKDVNTFATLDDQWASRLMKAGIRVRMHVVFNVFLFKREVCLVHGMSPQSGRERYANSSKHSPMMFRPCCD
jgi:hypothetical protein